jgi:hypothetical protein
MQRSLEEKSTIFKEGVKAGQMDIIVHGLPRED